MKGVTHPRASKYGPLAVNVEMFLQGVNIFDEIPCRIFVD